MFDSYLMDNEVSEAFEASPSPQPGTDYFENAEVEVLTGGGAYSDATSGATSVAGDESNVSTQGKSDVSGIDYYAHVAAAIKPCVTVMTCSSLCSSTSSLSSSSFSCHDLSR